MNEVHPRCLIVLTALRFTEEYGQAALRKARDRGENPILLLVVDREISEQVSGQLADVGFLGEKLMHELRDAMIDEYRDRGLGHLEALAERAREFGLEVETKVLDGPFLDSVLAVAKEAAVARIVVARMKRPHVSRLFFGSEVARLEREAGCPVEVYRWSGKRLSSERDEED